MNNKNKNFIICINRYKCKKMNTDFFNRNSIILLSRKKNKMRKCNKCMPKKFKKNNPLIFRRNPKTYYKLLKKTNF